MVVLVLAHPTGLFLGFAQRDEVIARTFPQPENWFGMKDEVYDDLLKQLKD